MKPFFPRLGQKPASRADARNAALMNQLATPGLGSLMAGRWIAGTGQLILFLAGFVLLLVWFFEVMIQYYGQVTGDVPTKPVGWVGITGAILSTVSWFWALATSISLLIKARSTPETEPAPSPVPPKLS
jgi:hypothetical protein